MARPTRNTAETPAVPLPTVPVPFAFSVLPAVAPGPAATVRTPDPTAAAAPPLTISVATEPGEPRVEILRGAPGPVGERAFALQLDSKPAEQPEAGASTIAAPPPAALAKPDTRPRDASSGEKSDGDADAPPAPATEKHELPEAFHSEPPSPPIVPSTIAPQLSVQAAPAVSHPAPSAPVAAEVVAAPPEAAPQPPAAPAQHIALRVSTADDRMVDVRLVSRAGDVHVSVHTPDETLAHTMRTELGSLTGKLSQAGYAVQTAGAREDSQAGFGRRDNAPDDGGARQSRQDGRPPSQQQGRDRRAAWFFTEEDSEE